MTPIEKVIQDLGLALALYQKGFVNGSPLDDAIVVELTDICDYGACPCCYLCSQCDSGNEMSDALLLGIMRAIAFLASPKEIWLAGGEPTVFKQLLKAIGIIHKVLPESEICLVTNGFNLADEKFAEKIVSCKAIKEIAITWNSADRDTHSALMTPLTPHEKNWAEVEIVDDVKNCIDKDSMAWKSYDLIIQALLNVHKLRQKHGRKDDLRIAINLNINSAYDLSAMVNLIEARGGKIDKVMLQGMKKAGRAKDIPENHPLIWLQEPTIEMMSAYLNQIKKLLRNRQIEEAMFIYPLPNDIVVVMGLEQNAFYQPAATPCIGPTGLFREDVVS
jgi:MoaA/NifB/PqqE/SkfB family radical SAM enzyme